jgi:hypothetical protein
MANFVLDADDEALMEEDDEVYYDNELKRSSIPNLFSFQSEITVRC